MGGQIVYGVAENLSIRLASATFHEFGSIYGVMEELESLKRTVDVIKAVLLDVEDKQQQNHPVQVCIRRLKDVLHPANNLLDEFLIQDMRHKTHESHKNKTTKTKVLQFFSPNRFGRTRRVAHEIGKLQKEFNDIVHHMTLLNRSPIVAGDEHRETTFVVFKSNIIGREDDTKKIISLLRQSHDENHYVSVVAIVGIGGLGKTTLAQLVYNDDEVAKIFEKHMWVCVAGKFDVKTIVKRIMESLVDSRIDDTLSLENLHNMLCDNLTGKKYLLVLDDVWNESAEKWAQLRNSLTCGAQGSKVVVTTRSKIVAQAMGVSVSYILNGLNRIESWSLLKNIVTRGDEIKVVNQNLESIVRR